MWCFVEGGIIGEFRIGMERGGVWWKGKQVGPLEKRRSRAQSGVPARRFEAEGRGKKREKKSRGIETRGKHASAVVSLSLPPPPLHLITSLLSSPTFSARRQSKMMSLREAVPSTSFIVNANFFFPRTSLLFRCLSLVIDATEPLRRFQLSSCKHIRLHGIGDEADNRPSPRKLKAQLQHQNTHIDR